MTCLEISLLNNSIHMNKREILNLPSSTGIAVHRSVLEKVKYLKIEKIMRLDKVRGEAR